ncbi:hypothetical protein Vi05172_g8348 [Venturia inaequalis]|nr:hypothetical protein Vi05172_g8348 [Venturia inaequalis]
MPSCYDSPLMVFFYTRASIGPSVHSLFRSYKEKVAENAPIIGFVELPQLAFQLTPWWYPANWLPYFTGHSDMPSQ